MNGAQQSSLLINREYNPLVASTILKRYWWWTLLFVTCFTAIAFVYLRYTKPIYDSSMVIQLGEKDQGKEIVDIENINTKDNIASEIELLRSELLFGMAIERLHMNVSLFSKGRILTEEKYLQSSFNVQPFQLKDSSLCDIPIWIELNGNKVKLSYQLNGKSYSMVQPINSRFSNQHFDIAFKVDNLQELRSDDEQNDLYFTFNNKKTLIARLLPNLEITPADIEAKTILIRYQGYNAELCHDITNAVAEAFFTYDEEVKRKSAENILVFINKQLDSISGELQISKDSLTLFQRSAQLNDPETDGMSLTQNMDQFQDQLFMMQEEMSTLKLVSSKLRNDPNRLEIYRLIPEMMGKSFETSLTKQIGDLHSLLERKEDLLFDVTEDNAEIKSINIRIQSKIQSIRRSVEAIEERISNNIKIIQGKVNQFQGEYSQLPGKKMEYSRLKSLQELNEKYFAILTDKLALYSISNAGYSSNNRVLNEATIASAPVSPNRKMVYAGFIFIGVILGFGVLVFRYVTYNEINSMEDLK
ncbi:MAG: hypothetical protein HYZ43_00770, partial [Flavobacteriia bacterium]|nr:hypothetical protein [Flavobacteriia bacterium]